MYSTDPTWEKHKHFLQNAQNHVSLELTFSENFTCLSSGWIYQTGYLLVKSSKKSWNFGFGALWMEPLSASKGKYVKCLGKNSLIMSLDLRTSHSDLTCLSEFTTVSPVTTLTEDID